ANEIDEFIRRHETRVAIRECRVVEDVVLKDVRHVPGRRFAGALQVVGVSGQKPAQREALRIVERLLLLALRILLLFLRGVQRTFGRESLLFKVCVQICRAASIERCKLGTAYSRIRETKTGSALRI